jgi:hypothetical protein
MTNAEIESHRVLVSRALVRETEAEAWIASGSAKTAFIEQCPETEESTDTRGSGEVAGE